MAVEGEDGEAVDVGEVGQDGMSLGAGHYALVEYSVQTHVLQLHLQQAAAASIQHQVTSLQGRRGYARLKLRHYMIHNYGG